MSYSPIDDVYAATQEGTFQQQEDQLQLTPEEIQVLRECSREGIVARAIPLGFVGGIIGLMGARSGPLMSAKFGVKPAVIGLGLIGYFMGRVSYSSICFNRALEVPNGSLRKFYKNKNSAKEYIDPAEKYYANIEPTHDPVFKAQSSGSDIEIPTTSSFDTTPSEYYKESPEPQPRDAPPQNYTSYDELRKQNRREYSDRMYNETVRRTPQPPEGGLVRRPPPPPSYQPPSDQLGGAKTKYGDVWDS